MMIHTLCQATTLAKQGFRVMYVHLDTKRKKESCFKPLKLPLKLIINSNVRDFDVVCVHQGFTCVSICDPVTQSMSIITYWIVLMK